MTGVRHLAAGREGIADFAFRDPDFTGRLAFPQPLGGAGQAAIHGRAGARLQPAGIPVVAEALDDLRAVDLEDPAAPLGG